MFNPKVKDLIEKKNPSVLGLYWAMYWRVFVLGLAFYILVAVVSLI